jgi:hypothetical protein
MSRKKNVWVTVSASRPGPSPIVVLDGETMKRAYYRDESSPAGCAWYHCTDPDAVGTLVLMPE